MTFKIFDGATSLSVGVDNKWSTLFFQPFQPFFQPTLFFFGRIKLKAYFRDTPNKKNDDESRLFKQNKNKKWTPPNKHHTINTYVEAVKKDIEQSKTVTRRKIDPI